jgi:hypothetical protein
MNHKIPKRKGRRAIEVCISGPIVGSLTHIFAFFYPLASFARAHEKKTSIAYDSVYKSGKIQLNHHSQFVVRNVKSNKTRS